MTKASILGGSGSGVRRVYLPRGNCCCCGVAPSGSGTCSSGDGKKVSQI